MPLAYCSAHNLDGTGSPTLVQFLLCSIMDIRMVNSCANLATAFILQALSNSFRILIKHQIN